MNYYPIIPIIGLLAIFTSDGDVGRLISDPGNDTHRALVREHNRLEDQAEIQEAAENWQNYGEKLKGSWREITVAGTVPALLTALGAKVLNRRKAGA